ncbi:hypothetical protein BDP27DRAFT_1370601 [Rhodocollybia butyracea]|uniref:Uncharacterized protein n=1 Tax=Rhodocollybia butyracea TaxID=206335 RepID=A0A9P5PDV7_9AGAR|nr:hypothetical protein BDP27DRAFT_1370601 [Rhodocollybia butyracea]
MALSEPSVAELEMADAYNVIPGIVVQSALTGILTLLISISTFTLWRQGIRHSRPRQFMLTASLLMYIASGTLWVMNVYAAVRELQGGHAGMEAFSMRTLYVWSEVASIALFFNFWISDMVVMWRACVLWGWCIRVRITFAVFVIAPAVLVIVDVSTSHPATSDTIFQPKLCGLAAILVSLISNVWATSLIAYKAWVTRKEILDLWGPKGKMPPAQGVLVLLAESGSLYSIVWVTFIASTTYTMIKGSTPITHAISYFIPSFVALYPTLIIVLVSLRMTHWREDSGLLELSILLMTDILFSRVWFLVHQALTTGAGRVKAYRKLVRSWM